MKRILEDLYFLPRVIVRVNKTGLNSDLQKKIISTWINVFIFRRFNSSNKKATIAGYKVNFLDFDFLTVLYREIFLENQYYFISEKKSPFIIDCGSNIGISVLYFKMLYPNSRIITFEPGEEAYLCLEENVKNNTPGSVKNYRAAISGKEGKIDFFYDKERVGSLEMSTFHDRMPRQMRRVDSYVLSKFINEDVDFLKIDIEGAEIDVLEELKASKKLDFVRQMVVEYHHHISSEMDCFSTLLQILEDAGFGYQIKTNNILRLSERKQFQDILVYAYHK